MDSIFLYLMPLHKVSTISYITNAHQEILRQPYFSSSVLNFSQVALLEILHFFQSLTEHRLHHLGHSLSEVHYQVQRCDVSDSGPVREALLCTFILAR